MIYVSIDLETTGLEPDYCQVLEIGAVAQELGGRELSRFHAFIDYEWIRGSPFALQLNARVLKAISEGRGVDPEVLVYDFAGWLEIYQDDGHVNVAGKNAAGFDIPFLKQFECDVYVEDERPITNQFRYRVLDPGTMYLRPGDNQVPGLSECLRRAGLDDKVTHDALDDALKVRDVIEHWWASRND